jgi:hypothetical protein
MESTPKRNAPVQVGLTGDDLALLDQHIDGVVFNVSRSEFGVVAIRFMLDTLRRGGWSLEALFQFYRKRPLAPLSAIEMARAARLAALLDAYRQAAAQGAMEAVVSALLFGLEELEAYGFKVPAEEQEAPRLRA